MSTPCDPGCGEYHHEQIPLLAGPERLIVTITPVVDGGYALHVERQGVFDDEARMVYGRPNVRFPHLLELVSEALVNLHVDMLEELRARTD